VSSVNKVVVEAPEEATPTLTTPLWASEMQDKCYKKTVGEEATFLETTKDYFNQFKEIPTQKKNGIFLKNYFYQKCSSEMSLAPTPVLFWISHSVR
jgi:hypothetical protein